MANSNQLNHKKWKDKSVSFTGLLLDFFYR